MLSPFPGMDPYLESPDLWPDVHHRLISEIQAALNAALCPRYVGRIVVRAYLDQENVEVKEARVEVRQPQSNSHVTVIEIVSPGNKKECSSANELHGESRRGAGSSAHWVEIDLLREGISPAGVNLPLPPSDYRIMVSRADRRPYSDCWPVSVRQPLPIIGIPLRGKDADVPLDLSTILRTAYERGAYDESIDYRQPPDPPLSPDDAKWAARLLVLRGCVSSAATTSSTPLPRPSAQSVAAATNPGRGSSRSGLAVSGRRS